MKVSYNWLKEFINTNENPTQLAEILTQTGLEVESIHPVGAVKGGLEGVLTGQVIHCEKHPDADKLKITKVDVGSEILQIVCGAPNVAVSQKVLVALAGTTIYPTKSDAITLKKVKIRGVESNGMICAEDELGLGDSHDGIMVLPNDTVVGIPAAKALNIDSDFILEIGLTPNRCDAMGHLGVARDLCAYLNHREQATQKVKLPETNEYSELSSLSISMHVENLLDCSAYSIGFMEEIKVGPSPEWLSQRLLSIGVNPINNVVDCANYVMYELGTPLHVFDASFFTKSLVVRTALQGEHLLTLDGENRELKGNELIIEGDGNPHCLAGVMGGKESGVSEATQNILVESARFNPSCIRKTAKQHGIHSDSSFRFERGVDPDLNEFALKRVLTLIQATCGGTCRGIKKLHSHQEKNHVFALDSAWMNQRLGTNLTESQMKGILTSLDFVALNNNEWSIPRYRSDVQRPIDVAEELIRIAGFEAVENPSKWQFSVPVHEAKSANKIRKSIAEKLASNGFREIMNNSLSKSAYANLSKSKQDGKAIELKNPLSRDLAILRTSMLWGMLETISYNRNRQASNLRLFEFGHTYHAFGNKMVEKPTLCLALTGIHEPESWMGTRNSSFFDLKGYLVNLIRSMNPTSIEECPLNPESAFSAGIEIKVNGKPLAQIGKVSNTWLKEFDLKQGVFAAQIDWKRWIELSKNSTNSFQELPKSFTVRRDFALLIDHSTSFSTLAMHAKKAASKQLIDVQLFDVYEGKNIAEGKKSYALAFYFRDPERTLTDEEIDADMNAIRNALESSCGATLR